MPERIFCFFHVGLLETFSLDKNESSVIWVRINYIEHIKLVFHLKPV
ncbi:MAG: hypothetical protein GXY77_01945 [Fibrobacter sp.]|nr:hypothetical protein [Fibrobacter sp.]